MLPGRELRAASVDNRACLVWYRICGYGRLDALSESYNLKCNYIKIKKRAWSELLREADIFCERRKLHHAARLVLSLEPAKQGEIQIA